MSGETEIEVSVVSEEDLELEGSRSSSTPADLLLQEKNGKGSCGLAAAIGNHHRPFSFDVGKPALRPVGNPQYTSFSIQSILGRSVSPRSDSTSNVSSTERRSTDVEVASSPVSPPSSRTNNQRIHPSCASPPRISSPTSLRQAVGHQQRASASSNQIIDNSRNDATSIGVGCTSPPSPTVASTFSPTNNDATTNPLLGHQAADLAHAVVEHGHMLQRLGLMSTLINARYPVGVFFPPTLQHLHQHQQQQQQQQHQQQQQQQHQQQQHHSRLATVSSALSNAVQVAGQTPDINDVTAEASIRGVLPGGPTAWPFPWRPTAHGLQTLEHPSAGDVVGALSRVSPASASFPQKGKSLSIT
ncbi:hypothetical protein M0802_014528 [Mischocyttarus mexicanus]|nr:hypothetical protein M0802_014528 [Mischocyttarus mexicanus]